MPRVEVTDFLGSGSNVLRCTNQSNSESINVYWESSGSPTAKVKSAWLGTPGLSPFASVTDTPGFTIFYQDGRCFVVIGQTFAEVFSNGSTLAYSTTLALSSSMLPASIVSNGTAGNQLLVVAGGQGYVFNLLLNTLTTINTTNFPGTGFPVGTALMCEFMDGYGLVLVQNSRQFLWSALEDFTSWNALDVAERSEGSDNIQTMKRNHREIWFLGTKTGEVWYDSGDALTPFSPVPGVFIEYGSASVSSARVNGTVGWIGLSERGIGVMNLADGYAPKPISTTAIDRYLQSSTQLAAAKLFSLQQEGHVFLVINVPDLDTCPVYDYSTNQWHKRAMWDDQHCVWTPWIASGQSFAFGNQLVIDRNSGNIYSLSLTTYGDTVV